MLRKIIFTLIIGFASFYGVFGASGQVSAINVTRDIERKLNVTPEQRRIGAGIFKNVTLACFEYGQCTLCDILIVLIEVSNIILRLFAILALIFFLWGAGYLVLSSGNEQMINKGKGIIRATIIGSIIVLVSWQIMSFIVITIANGSIFEEDQEPVQNNPITGWYAVAEKCGDQNFIDSFADDKATQDFVRDALQGE
jgi:hypothetical protein